MICPSCGIGYLAGVVGGKPWPKHECDNPAQRTTAQELRECQRKLERLRDELRALNHATNTRTVALLRAERNLYRKALSRIATVDAPIDREVVQAVLDRHPHPDVTKIQCTHCKRFTTANP
jgi:hypothetical protein